MAVPKRGSNSFYMFSASCAAPLTHLSTSCHIYILFLRAFVFFFPLSPIIHQSLSQKQGRSPGTKAVFLNKSIAESKISGGTNCSWCKSAEGSSQVRALCHVTLPAFQRALHAVPSRSTAERRSQQPEVLNLRRNETAGSRTEQQQPQRHVCSSLEISEYSSVGRNSIEKHQPCQKIHFLLTCLQTHFKQFFLTNCLGVKFHKR